MKALRHIWTGIVGAIAGAALAVLIQVIGQMTMGFSIDYLQWILLACAGIGFLLGVVIGPRSTKPKTHAKKGAKPGPNHGIGRRSL